MLFVSFFFFWFLLLMGMVARQQTGKGTGLCAHGQTDWLLPRQTMNRHRPLKGKVSLKGTNGSERD